MAETRRRFSLDTVFVLPFYVRSTCVETPAYEVEGKQEGKEHDKFDSLMHLASSPMELS